LSSLVFFIGNADIKSRILFNLPIGMFAAYGFVRMKRLLEDRDQLNLVFTSFSFVCMLAFLFRSLANLV
jgi:hypothetical protein